MAAKGNKPIGVRVDDVTRERWEAEAAKEGKRLAVWIRDAVNAYIDRDLGAVVFQSEPFEGPQELLKSDGLCRPAPDPRHETGGGKRFKGPDPKPDPKAKR